MVASHVIQAHCSVGSTLNSHTGFCCPDVLSPSSISAPLASVGSTLNSHTGFCCPDAAPVARLGAHSTLTLVSAVQDAAPVARCCSRSSVGSTLNSHTGFAVQMLPTARLVAHSTLYMVSAVQNAAPVARWDFKQSQKLWFSVSNAFDHPVAMAVFRRFLETCPPRVGTVQDLLPFYALPYVPDPTHHPAFRPVFQEAWVRELRGRLSGFLGRRTTTTTTSRPAIFSYLHHHRHHSSSVGAALVAQESAASAVRSQRVLRRRLQRLQEDYHKLIGVSWELTQALEAAVRGERVDLEGTLAACTHRYPELFTLTLTADTKAGPATILFGVGMHSVWAGPGFSGSRNPPKFSPSPGVVQGALIEGGAVEWLVNTLAEVRTLTPYTQEYASALFMNLTLRSAGRARCHPLAAKLLPALIQLLTSVQTHVVPYVTGALYSLLSHSSLRQEAFTMGLDSTLERLAQVRDSFLRSAPVIPWDPGRGHSTDQRTHNNNPRPNSDGFVTQVQLALEMGRGKDGDDGGEGGAENYREVWGESQEVELSLPLHGAATTPPRPHSPHDFVPPDQHNLARALVPYFTRQPHHHDPHHYLKNSSGTSNMSPALINENGDEDMTIVSSRSTSDPPAEEQQQPHSLGNTTFRIGSNVHDKIIEEEEKVLNAARVTHSPPARVTHSPPARVAHSPPARDIDVGKDFQFSNIVTAASDDGPTMDLSGESVDPENETTEAERKVAVEEPQESPVEKEDGKKSHQDVKRILPPAAASPPPPPKPGTRDTVVAAAASDGGTQHAVCLMPPSEAPMEPPDRASEVAPKGVSPDASKGTRSGVPKNIQGAAAETRKLASKNAPKGVHTVSPGTPQGAPQGSTGASQGARDMPGRASEAKVLARRKA
nr:uncharacterized protein LOC128703292 [Cherax quadricarinatus]